MRHDTPARQLQMDPKADVVLLFNARDVDKNGQPLLMKVVARERADLSKIDLSRYRTQADHNDITKFDVQKVADNADYIEVQDADEMEFQFGGPLKQTSLDGKGNELSTSVKVNPENTQLTHVYNRVVRPDRLRRTETVGGANKAQSDGLDRQPVAHFDERIRVTVQTKDTFPEGAWLDETVDQHLKVGLHVDRGFVFEPGADASVKLLATELKTSVPIDDAQLLGSPSQASNVTLANQNVRWLLGQNVTITTVAAATSAADRHSSNKRVVDLLYANKASIQVANGGLNPMGDKTLKAADFEAGNVKVSKRPLPNDPERDGQTVSLTLGKGFLTAKDGEASLEVRVYNKDGIPAERVLIPLREVGWAADA